MCTLCLSDMGELRDEWLRELRPPVAVAPTPRPADIPVPIARETVALLAPLEAAAA